MKANIWKSAVLFSVIAIPAWSQKPVETDPKVGKFSYEGTGASEKPPEYSDVRFTFSVDCRTSADDARQAIEAVSGQVWKSISAKVPEKATSETQRAYWGSIGDIVENEGSQVFTTKPSKVEGEDQKGVAKRIDRCTKKEIALTANPPSVYSASQSLGVRTTDLDWAEALIRTVQKLPQDKESTTVKVSTDSVDYNVSEPFRRVMLAETLEKARTEAMGKGSKYESDKKTLKFASAHFLGSRPSSAPRLLATIGEPVAKGKAPKVELTVPITYTIYAEAKDLIDTNSKKLEGVRSDYEATGRAITDADYAVVSASIKVRCQATKEAAIKATETISEEILKDMRAFHGEKTASSETDRIENNELGEPNGTRRSTREHALGRIEVAVPTGVQRSTNKIATKHPVLECRDLGTSRVGVMHASRRGATTAVARR